MKTEQGPRTIPTKYPGYDLLLIKLINLYGQFSIIASSYLFLENFQL
jgi:hypothetical protein